MGGIGFADDDEVVNESTPKAEVEVISPTEEKTVTQTETQASGCQDSNCKCK